MSDQRTASVQDRRPSHGASVIRVTSIPWGLHEMLWRIYADHGHDSQSAERLDERGGFSRLELGMLAVGCYGDSGWPAKGKCVPLLDLYNALDAIYDEANNGTDDAHRRLVKIMALVTAAKTGEQS